MIEIMVTGVTGGATIALAVITWRYVSLTKDILEENRQMRLDAQKPKIVIYPYQVRDTATHRTQLRIENIGPGVAYDVQFKTDHNFRVDAWFSLEDIPVFNKGINCFKPGGLKSCEISPNELNRQRQTSLKIDVAYKDSRDEKYSEPFYIDFSETQGVVDGAPESQN